MASQSFAPAQSIRLQLHWCRDVVLGISRESLPGALTMGLIAVREFDMYGDRPELSSLINEVQRLMQEELDDARRAGDSRSHRLPGRPGGVYPKRRPRVVLAGSARSCIARRPDPSADRIAHRLPARRAGQAGRIDRRVAANARRGIVDGVGQFVEVGRTPAVASPSPTRNHA